MVGLTSLRARLDRLPRQQKIKIIGTLTAVFSLIVLLSIVFHERILNWAKPIAEKYTRRPGGFLVPSILLIVVSIPPFFGHELISVLTGFVYGNVGFFIVIISTTIGESILFLSFRHLFTHKMAQFRDKYKEYDIFVRVIEEGGPLMIFAIRSSAIPSHFSTPLLASIKGIEYRTWLICCLCACWTEYPPVYLGWLLKRGESSRATPWLIGFAAIVTVMVGAWIYFQYRHQRSVYRAAHADLEARLLDSEMQARTRSGRDAGDGGIFAAVDELDELVGDEEEEEEDDDINADDDDDNDDDDAASVETFVDPNSKKGRARRSIDSGPTSVRVKK